MELNFVKKTIRPTVREYDVETTSSRLNKNQNFRHGKRFQFFRKCWRRALGFALPILLLPLPLYYQTQVAKCSYIIILTVSYWIVEPVGVPVSALIPVFLFPMMSILDTSVACKAMMKDPVMNYMGCFALGIAIEESGLHKRIAYKLLLSIGTSIRRLTFGCMLVTMLMSMWLNNLTATMSMVPIVETLLRELKFDIDPEVGDEKADMMVKITAINDGKVELLRTQIVRSSSKGQKKRIKLALMLSLTYGASFGGIATLNGSGPNFVFKGIMEELYPNHEEPTYATWMLCHIPVAVICTLLSSFFLQIVYLGLGILKSTDSEIRTEKSIANVLKKKYEQLGSFTFREGAVLFLLSFLVVIWFMREPKFIPGWGTWLSSHVRIEDATPSIGVALLLFLIPSDPKNLMTSVPLLDWKTFQKRIPWGLLMLVGSGFVVAEGTKKSGFSTYVAESFMTLEYLTPGAMAFVVCLSTAALTEFLNNMVATSMTLPILSQLAQLKNINPLLLMIPATIGSSFAFMFPVSQPSNAIVFQRGELRTYQLMFPGIVMNILCCCVEVFIFNALGYYIFDLKDIPWWALQAPGSSYSSVANISNENATNLYFTGNISQSSTLLITL